MNRTTVSPTAIQTWLECPRKLAWRDSGVEVPEKPSAALGSRVHAVLEAYLIHGTMPDLTTKEGEIATAGLHHIPKPKAPGLYIEHEFTRTLSDVTFSGRKDMFIPALPLVGDHKTTSDFRWAKNALALEIDIQANVYAWNAMVEADKERCHMLWVYYRTRGTPESRPVMTTLHRLPVLQRMSECVATGREILEGINGCDDPLKFPANTNMCAAYGGCPYEHLCKISPYERLRAHMQQSNTKDFLAAIARGKAINPPVAETPAPAPAAPPATPFLAKLGLLTGKVPPAPTPPPPPPAPTPPPPGPAPTPVPEAPPQVTGSYAALLAAPPPAKRGPGRPRKEVGTVGNTATVPLKSEAGDALLAGAPFAVTDGLDKTPRAESSLRDKMRADIAHSIRLLTEVLNAL